MLGKAPDNYALTKEMKMKENNTLCVTASCH